MYQQLASNVIFPEQNQHYLVYEILTDDLHSAQVIKKNDKYVTIRLLTYEKHFNKDVMNKDKTRIWLVLFKGI